MAQDIINNDLWVAGNISSKSWTPPGGSVTDAAIVGAAGVQASKLQHQYLEEYFSGSSTTTAAADQRVIHTVCGLTGTITDFKAGCITPCTGNATITVDLWKNGVTILTATISLSSAQAARQLVAAAGFTSTTLAVNDVLEVKVTTAVGTGVLGLGLFARLNMREDAQ